jgi:hypothetical protein
MLERIEKFIVVYSLIELSVVFPFIVYAFFKTRGSIGISFNANNVLLSRRAALIAS